MIKMAVVCVVMTPSRSPPPPTFVFLCVCLAEQWGLLITFIELIKNPRYSFWSHSFTHCAPELERVFESVARSCMTPGAAGAGAGADDSVATGTAQ